MTRETVILERVEDGRIAVVRLNRPQARNALNLKLAEEFVATVEELEKDPHVRAVIVTGNGKAFCAGGDLGAFKASIDPGQFLHALASKFHEGIIKLRNMDAPFLAAVNGACFGVGLSLACACDLRISAADARFSVAFTGVGLSPDSSLTYTLPRIVGLTHATRLAMLNPVINAKEAMDIHLIMSMHDGDLTEAAIRVAENLAAMPTKAMGLVKRLYDEAYADTLVEHLDKEARCVGIAAATEDFREGCNAFFEGRKPVFRGR